MPLYAIERLSEAGERILRAGMSSEERLWLSSSSSRARERGGHG